MPRSAWHRLPTTFFVVLSLLFAQLALANYACPGKADAAVMAEMMASGQPCAGMDEMQPVLCHQHSIGAAQTFEAVKLPTTAPPALALVLVLPVVPAAEQSAGPLGVAGAASAEARPPPDPIFLSTLRLRV